jgi:hypothetical protein
MGATAPFGVSRPGSMNPAGVIQIEVRPFQEATTVLPRESFKFGRQHAKSQCQRLHRINTDDRVHDGLAEPRDPTRAFPVWRLVIWRLDRCTQVQRLPATVNHQGTDTRGPAMRLLVSSVPPYHSPSYLHEHSALSCASSRHSGGKELLTGSDSDPRVLPIYSCEVRPPALPASSRDARARGVPVVGTVVSAPWFRGRVD